MHTGNVTVINGWQLFGHPLFIERLDALVAEAEALAEVSPDDFHKHSLPNCMRRSRTQSCSVFLPTRAPQPTTWAILLVKTSDIGNGSRAGFLIGIVSSFNIAACPKSIIYAWLNDNLTLRKAGARTDVYRVFRAMLEGGRMPNSFQELMRAATPMEAGGEEQTGFSYRRAHPRPCALGAYSAMYHFFVPICWGCSGIYGDLYSYR